MVNDDGVLASAKQKADEIYKDHENNKFSFKRIGQSLVTGFVQGAKPKRTPSQYLTEQQQKRFKPMPVNYPNQSQVIQFVSTPEEPTPNIDEYEELKRQINIPRKPRPPVILRKNNDLSIVDSFEIHMDTFRNPNDLGYGEDVVTESFYEGLDIL